MESYIFKNKSLFKLTFIAGLFTASILQALPLIKKTQLGTSAIVSEQEIFGEFYGEIIFEGSGAAGNEINYLKLDGTTSVHDINAQGSSDPGTFTILNRATDSLAYFYGFNGMSKRLYYLDSTNTLNEVLTPLGASFKDGCLMPFGEKIYFLMDTTGNTNYQLYRANEQNYESVKNFSAVGGMATDLVYHDETYLYFMAKTSATGNELYRTQGSDTSTELFIDISPSSADTYLDENRAVLSDKMMVGIEQNCLTGCANVIPAVINFSTGTLEYLTGLTGMYGAVATQYGFIFSAYSAATGYEIWKSDGTSTGTQLIKDIEVGSQGSSPSYFKEFESSVYFRAYTVTEGIELYKYDGANVVKITDFVGSASTDPYNIIEHQNKLYFSGEGPTGGRELYRLDNDVPLLHLEIGPSTLSGLSALNHQFISDGKQIYALGKESSTYEMYRINQLPDYATLSHSIVDENVNPGFSGQYFATTLLSSDLDNNILSYQLIAGAGDVHNSYFSILNDSLYFNTPPNYEMQSSYSIRLSVKDGFDAVDTFMVITINNKNDMPSMPSLTNLNVLYENEPVNSYADSISSYDEDGDFITFSLVSGEGDIDNDKFNFVGGKLFTTEVLDYEIKKDYQIRVMASDGIDSNTTNLSLSIYNVNEAPKFFSSIADTIKEGVKYLEELDLKDPDGDDIDVFIATKPTWLTFSESSDSVRVYAGTGTTGNPDDVFRKNANITKPKYIKYHNGKIYFSTENFIKVIENDTVKNIAGNGVAANSADGSVAKVSSINNPQGIAITENGEIYFAESGANKIRKININGNLETLAGVGASGYSGDLGNAMAAELNSPYGLIYKPDFNQLVWVEKGNHVVRTLDINQGTISTVFGTGTAGLSDTTLNGPVDLCYEESNYRYYVVNETSNTVVSINNASTYTLVAGTGVPGYSNDNAAGNTAMLNKPSGIACGKESLFITDKGNNRIRIVNTTTGIIKTAAGVGAVAYNGEGYGYEVNLNEPMGITKSNGDEIYFSEFANNRIRTFSKPSFILSGMPTMSDTGLVAIKIIATSNGGLADTLSKNIYVANENTPPLFGADRVITLKENNSFPTLVDSLFAIDPDSLDTLQYEVYLNDDESIFSFETNGKLIQISNLDRELKSTYLIGIRVFDGLVYDSIQIQINVEDENDNAPILIDANFNINDSVVKNTEIGQLNFSDLDTTGIHTFTMIGANAWLTLTTDGRLLTQSELTPLPDTTLIVYCKISDGVFADTALVNVTINNEINGRPLFVSDKVILLDENSIYPQKIDSLFANDPDPYDVLNYKIIANPDTALFDLDSNLNLNLIGNLDYEKNKSYLIKVEVSDAYLKDTLLVTINVNDINDNAPVIIDTSLSVNANVDTSTIIGFLNFTDVDINDKHFFTIIGGIPEFNIEDDGAIRTTTSINSLRGKTISFPVEISDGIYKDTAKVFINILNTNLLAPVLASDSIVLQENHLPQSFVYKLSATDQDTDISNLRYHLINGSADSVFVLDSLTGDIVTGFGKFLNFEKVNNYVLKFEVSDGINADTATLFIGVENVNEPITDLKLDVNSVDQNLIVGSLIANVIVIDDDISEPYTSYSLKVGNGDDHNDYVSIVNNEVTLTKSLKNFIGDSLRFRVGVVGVDGVGFEKELVMKVFKNSSMLDSLYYVFAANEVVSKMGVEVNYDTFVLLNPNFRPLDTDEKVVAEVLISDDIFDVAPVVNSEGTLSFKTKENVFGLFSIEIRATLIKNGSLIRSSDYKVVNLKVINTDTTSAQVPQVDLFAEGIQGIRLSSDLEWRIKGADRFEKGQGQFKILTNEILEIRTSADLGASLKPIKEISLNPTLPSWSPSYQIVEGVGVVKIAKFTKAINEFKDLSLKMTFKNSEAYIEKVESKKFVQTNVSLLTGVNNVDIELIDIDGSIITSWKGSVDLILENIVSLTAVDSTQSTWMMGGFGSYDSSFYNVAPDHFDYVYHWNETAKDDALQSRYETIDKKMNHRIGWGYWVFQDQALSFKMPKQKRATEHVINLTNSSNGWNQIANPYNFPLDINSIEPKGLEFYAWDRKTFSYKKAINKLEPKRGYWVFVKENTSLKLSPVPYLNDILGASEVLPANRSLVESNGQIQLLLESKEYKDDHNYIGLSQNSEIKAEMPSSMDNQLSLSLIDGTKYLMSQIKTDKESSIWNIKVHSGVSGLNRANLTLGGLSHYTDQGYTVKLRELGGKELNLVQGRTEVKVSAKGENYQLQLIEPGIIASWDFAHKVIGDEVIIEMSDFKAGEKVLFEVFDPNGTMVYKEEALSEQSLKFKPFNDLTGGNGFYHYKIRHQGKTKVGKILRY